MVENERPFFKIWAAEALLSDDLDALSDQDRSIWLFLMCVTSLETPRWRAEINARLARKCKTTVPKLAAAINRMAALGMLKVDGKDVHMATAERWNESTERRKKPSDEAEAARARKAAERDRKKNVTPPVTPSHAAHKEEEEEEEKEEEEDLGRDTPPGDAAFRDRYGTLVVALGKPIDQRLADEFTQIAEEHSLEEIQGAIRKCRAAGEQCWPSKVLKHLAPTEPPRVISKIPNPFFDGFPGAPPPPPRKAATS